MISARRPLSLAASAVAALLFASALAVIPVATAQADTKPTTGAADTVSSDALPTVQINGVAWTQLVVGNTVYVGGEFTQAQPAGAAAGVNTTPRNNMLAYDVTTGNLITSFAPSFNAAVRGIAASADGSTLYVVGAFTQVNGVNEYRTVALNAATGAVITKFKATTNSSANSVAVAGNTVYIGGQFSSMNSVSRSRVAAVDATTGAVLPWNPITPDGYVRAIVVSPDRSKVVLGGSFTSLNGSTRPGDGLGAVDATTGASVAWNVGKTIYAGGQNASIYSLWSDGTNVYGSGYVFGGVQDGNLEGVFNASWTDGTINWIEDCHGDTYGVASLGDTVYTVSHAHYCGNMPGGFAQTDPNPSKAKKQYSLAYSKQVAGTLAHDTYGAPYADLGGQPAPRLLTWYPDLTPGTYTGQSQAAWSISAGSGYLVLGGEFATVNGQRQTGLVRFTTTDKAPNADGPRTSGSAWPATAVSLSTGTARVSWPSNWDRDNANLTYVVSRRTGSGAYAPVYSSTSASHGFWDRPQLGFVDKGLTPGSTYTYRVSATDPFGNTVNGAAVTVTASASSAASPYSNAVLADGASDFWRFGEGGGPTVYDWAGYNDLTAGSGVAFNTTGAIAGDTNTAATFSGNADASGLAATSTAIPGPNTFTEEAWFRTTSTAGGKILGFGNANSGTSSSYDRHVYMDASGRVYFGVYDGNTETLQSTTSLNDGQWHQVVASLGSGGMQLFIDGKRVGARADVTAGQDYSGYWRVGGDSSWNGANFFAGDIDDVAVYPTVLASSTVKSHYNLSGRGSSAPAPTDAYGKQVFQDSPDLFWRLGDAVGSSTAADASGNGDTGNVQNGVVFGRPGAPAAPSDGSAGFNGTDGQIVASQRVSDPEVYTEELWFNTTTTSGGKLIGFGDAQTGQSGNYDRHIWMQDDGKLVFGIWTGSATTISSTGAYNDGKWHQVVATQGADGLNMYVDGTLIGSNPTKRAQSYDGHWRLGGDPTWFGASSNYFNGLIDEVSVYGSALSATQVANHYALGSGTANHAPTAAFTAGATDLTVTLDATGSSDSDGTISSYAWDFGDGVIGSGANTSHAYAAPGTYQVALTITDDDGASSQVVKTVTVSAANAAPTAAFTSTATALDASFDGRASTDSDGTVAAYAWSFGDGGSGTGSTTAHSYAAAGTYTVRLTVTDDDGSTGTVSHDVTVSAANVAPTASFTSTVNGLNASFDGTASADSDGTVASYAWSFGDGGSATGSTANHAYSAAGTYSVRLTVTDDDGASASTTHDIAATPSTGTGATVVAADEFGRTATGGLGTADTGGAWTSGGTASRFSVSGGTAKLSTIAGGQLSGYLTGTSAVDTDSTADFTFSAVPTGAASYGGLLVRRSGSTDYSARVAVQPSGAVNLELLRGSTSVRTVRIGGVTVAAGTALSLRVQAIGTSPTTLQARVWVAGTAEPSGWQATMTDSTSGLQAAGSVGIRANSAGGVTNGPIVVSVDHLAVTTPSTTTPPASDSAPTAAFTSSSSGLVLSVDGTGSSDKEGPIASYAWTFGDSGTATGATANHTYAAAGDYPVRLTVTDSAGQTGTVTRTVTVTAPGAPPAGGAAAADAFSRTVTSGLGSADTGGAWTTSGTASRFAVTNGGAVLTTAAGAQLAAYLNAVSIGDVDATATITLPSVPAGAAAYAGLVVRRIGSSDYNARVAINPSGTVNVELLRGSTSLRNVRVVGLTAAAGTVLHLRVQAIGSGTTTLQARAWADGAAEPTTWQASATDATTALQGSGAVGLRSYASGSLSNGPLGIRFDDLVVTAP